MTTDRLAVEHLDPAQVASLITKAQELLQDPNLPHHRSVRVRNKYKEMKTQLWQLNRAIWSLSHSINRNAAQRRATVMEWEDEDNGHVS